MNTRLIRRSVSLIASALVTFTVVESIANYAIPAEVPQLMVRAETATPNAALCAVR